MAGQLPIRSVQNAAVRSVRKLHQIRERARSGRFLAEGPKLVAEALRAGAEIQEVWVSPRGEERAPDDLIGRLASRGVTVRRAADHVLSSLSDAATSQGLVAVVRRPSSFAPSLPEPRESPLALVATGLQEPGNLGSLVRIAEAFSRTAVIFCGGTDPWGPKAVRASAGSVFRASLFSWDDPAGAVEQLDRRGYRLVAAVAAGGGPPEPTLHSRPTALLVGAEGGGLDEELVRRCHGRVTIPLSRGVESLNVAAAAAVLLYAATRRV